MAEQCGGTPVDVFVDLDALIGLQSDLAAVRAGLEAMRNGVPGADPGALGSAEVAHAVTDFVAGWRDGRERILDELNQCVSGLADAIAAYQQTEAALRTAVAGPGR